MYSILNEVLNMYLYGSKTAPSLEDLLAGIHIRDPGPNPTIDVDVGLYMDNGPGRFAGAHMFDVVKLFFDLDVSVLISYGFELDRSYTEQEVNALLISNGHQISALVEITQSFYDEGSPDYMERAFIWNTTAFEIEDRDADGQGGARFLINAAGERNISDLHIVPYVKTGFVENFDFTGSWFSNLFNVPLELIFDPSGIGRTVDFNFTGASSGLDLVKAEYEAMYHGWPQPGNYANAAAKLALEGPAFMRGIFESGEVPYQDNEGRPIIFGTNEHDEYGSLLDRYKLDLHPYLASAWSQNGIAYVAGRGNDTITGGRQSDALYGGIGNDVLDGGGGDDKLYGGTGDDTYVVDESGDLVVENVNGGIDLVKSSVHYALTENVEKLELTGSENLNGTGNEIDNVIRGNDGINLISGHGGDDELHGGGGDDQIWGGAGKDQIFGGDDDDTIYGGAENDELHGEDGDDYIYGGDGRDYLGKV